MLLTVIELKLVTKAISIIIEAVGEVVACD